MSDLTDIVEDAAAKDEGFHLHLVSDSTGETLNAIANAVLAQFEQAQAHRHSYVMVRTEGQLARVIEGIKQSGGIVFCTLVNETLQTALLEACETMDVPCVPLLDPAIKTLAWHLGIEGSHRPGRQHQLTDDYFDRIEALDYTMSHDDGQAYETLDEADIILVGVSRTSKTPTCIYLANRGIKAANVPIVPEIELPPTLFTVKRPMVVGLTLKPDRLIEIRSNRLRLLKSWGGNNDYTELDRVKAEVAEARRVFSKQDWPVIDVTRKSIEETAATILNHYEKWQAKKA